MEKLFQDRVMVISGGLGDIGRAICHQFAAQGAAIAIGDLRTVSESRDFLSELKQRYGVPSHYTQVDVSDPVAVDSWLQEVVLQLGVPSLVISNAATVTQAGVHQIGPEEWSRELRINLDGAFYLCQKATKLMTAQQMPGNVVFIGSWAAEAVHPGLPAYCVSKAGLRMLCKCMALELAPHQILVNELAPGYVNAGLSAEIWAQNPGLIQEAAEKVPLGKIMTAEDVARQVLYLCHPANTHLTGSTLLMDGGLSLRSV
ncbi:SDR family NAD(P)-dependent oxidoreductase [Pedobacter africanus]|uniref:Glucose 1-dehydrogenase n=1 Tax=Pedobacter africanus TaxID=151894 RepID=A0A1W2BYS3_9SPHI|nr:SDR family oxidoreductase [Pedobacter africanus]SMC78103.1 glucose 1-dehydrogenase [Pedobacter africanus]